MTTELTVQKPQSLVDLEEKAQELVEYSKQVKVETKEEYDEVMKFVGRCTLFDKEGGKEAESHYKPLYNQYKEVKGMFDSVLKTVGQAKQSASSVATQWMIKKRAEEAKEQERLNRLAEKQAARAEAKGEAPVVPEAVAQLVDKTDFTVEGEKGKTRMQDDYDIVVIDINKVPDEWVKKTVNESGLKQLARNTQGKAQVLGIKFVYAPRPVTMGTR